MAVNAISSPSGAAPQAVQQRKPEDRPRQAPRERPRRAHAQSNMKRAPAYRLPPYEKPFRWRTVAASVALSWILSPSM